MPSIFTKIIQGEIPAYRLAEDERFIAILDAFPNAKGHTICIPKTEVDKFYDMDDDTYADLMKFAKKTATALEKAIPCKRIGMAAIGLEVPHVHIHLVPLQHMSDMDFTQKKKVFTPEEFQQTAALIKSYL
ncbi:MAG: HIT family protein [Flavobacteriaceae bacterium]|nr:HIT family protein [Flavobacteriaceae bacterium]